MSNLDDLVSKEGVPTSEQIAGFLAAADRAPMFKDPVIHLPDRDAMTEIPKLTADEAELIRFSLAIDFDDPMSQVDQRCEALARKGLADPESGITDLGRAALAAYDAAERAKTVAPMLRLLIEARAIIEVSDLSAENQRETAENGAFHGYEDRRDSVLDAIRELIAKETP